MNNDRLQKRKQNCDCRQRCMDMITLTVENRRFPHALTAEDLSTAKADLLASAPCGAVLVSPRICPGEKRLAWAALPADRPTIVILEHGAPMLRKPPQSYFDACAAGRRLRLAPWQRHTEQRPLTHKQCLTLNTFTEQIIPKDNAP